MDSEAEQAGIGRWSTASRRSLIAVILGVMTIITFANVIARYVFNTNILWALETTVFLFAWLVLIGASYCVKTAPISASTWSSTWSRPALRKILALLSVACCLAFSILLLIGAWNYWCTVRRRSASGTRSTTSRCPTFCSSWRTPMNEGEPYEKLPRFIPYFALPLGMLLITLRFCQAAWQIVRGHSRPSDRQPRGRRSGARKPPSKAARHTEQRELSHGCRLSVRHGDRLHA